MANAICPGCRRPIILDEPIEEGDFFGCPYCQADLELVSVRPLVVDWADIEFAQPFETSDRHESRRSIDKQQLRKQRKSHQKYLELDFD
jgi:transcription initiation factor IIE alpha subunit